jgi:hypothetical protein
VDRDGRWLGLYSWARATSGAYTDSMTVTATAGSLTGLNALTTLAEGRASLDAAVGGDIAPRNPNLIDLGDFQSAAGQANLGGCVSFGDRFGRRFRATNSTLFTTLPGAAVRYGASFYASSYTASALGTPTLMGWGVSGFGGGTMVTTGGSTAALSGTEAGIIAGATGLINAVPVTGSLEVGVGLGSILGAGLDVMTDGCP